jgi:nitroreductase
MMDYRELLKKRRSIRDYQDKAVSDVVLTEILQDACLAPSASNHQPWKFIIIQDKNLIKILSDESKKNILAEIISEKNSPYQRYENLMSNPDFNVFYNAPCLVLLVGENHYPWFYEDCGLCAAYFMLAATARGLGTCWIGLGQRIQDKMLCEKIGLEKNLEIVAPLILGYPSAMNQNIVRHPPVMLKKL